MKLTIKLLLPLLFLTTFLNSQISFSSKHEGSVGKFGKGVIEKFKKTETIFVLSSVYDKATYEKILKNSWTVTPYKVVEVQNFNISDYLEGSYSFVQLAGRVRESENITSLFIYLDICMYDTEAIAKKKGKTKNIQKLLSSNKIEIARLFMVPTNEMVREAAHEENSDKTFMKMYTEAPFFNYTPGFLQNYFQKTSNLIEEGKEYWAYENESLEEISNLKTNTLYIPDYTVFLNEPPLVEMDKKSDPKEILKIFDDYDFPREVIDVNSLNEKILNGEEVYYLSYVRLLNKKFLTIVNSKTGELVYRNNIQSLLPFLRSKDIKTMSKAIKSGSK